jgi:hypothetical protein
LIIIPWNQLLLNVAIWRAFSRDFPNLGNSEKSGSDNHKLITPMMIGSTPLAGTIENAHVQLHKSSHE